MKEDSGMATVDFGLMLQPFPLNFPGIELFDYNRRLIRTLSPGFTTLWVEDHLQLGETATHECLTTLSYFAGEFPQFSVGALVLCQSYRNPALVAKMAANLQLLSGGRFILGLGAGWKEDEYHAYGYTFPDTKTRLEELEEAAIIVKAMWSSSPTSFAGQHYHIQDAYCEPQPRPSSPLLIGGGGEEKTLAIVARRADWWNFNSCTVEEYAHKLAILKSHCARVGRDAAEIKLTYLSTASVSENPDQLVRSPQKHFVSGNSAEVIRELERFHDIGVTHFIFRFLDPESLERFVDTVVPYFA
jgi:alkanesulfonate monooxygenase SsuD/methylene tetrahydromethanopterin reductase-like flavin-dependent oxidoreductase (luciferase family)